MMNQFLKSAVTRFDKLKGDKDFLISPLSQEDAEIIDELKVILKKSGREDVLEILKSYKEYKDQEIKENLLQWNIDHPSLGLKRLVDKTAEKIADESEKPEKQNWQFYKIGDISIRSFDLICWEIFEKNDKYYIRLNPTPDNAKGIPIHANYIVKFETEEYRNQVIDNLINFLGDQGIDTIEM